MTNAGHKFNPDRPVIYQITVQGYLDKSRADWFDGMVILPQVSVEGVSITQLTGEVVDQAALLGLLRKLYDLGLSLLSIKRIELDLADAVDIEQLCDKTINMLRRQNEHERNEISKSERES